MNKVLFVADGPRDEVVVPHLVAKLLGVAVDGVFRPWKDFRVTGGYLRKLKLAVRDAQDIGAIGVIATVDADKDRDRQKLKTLIQARDEDRGKNPPFPTAVGQADPHLEIWLLDDPVAVRTVVGLDHETEIQNVRRTDDPKAYLNQLIEKGKFDGTHMDCLRAIAASVVVDRCVHAHETGFQKFAEDVRSEFRAMTVTTTPSS